MHIRDRNKCVCVGVCVAADGWDAGATQLLDTPGTADMATDLATGSVVFARDLASVWPPVSGLTARTAAGFSFVSPLWRGPATGE
jgi:hypothetical protein